MFYWLMGELATLATGLGAEARAGASRRHDHDAPWVRRVRLRGPIPRHADRRPTTGRHKRVHHLHRAGGHHDFERVHRFALEQNRPGVRIRRKRKYGDQAGHNAGVPVNHDDDRRAGPAPVNRTAMGFRFLLAGGRSLVGQAQRQFAAALAAP